MKSLKLVVLSAIIILSCNCLKAQEILASVTCNYEQAAQIQKDYLQDFDKKLMDYINNYRWLGKNYGNDKVKVAISVLFSQTSNDNSYSARVVFESTRPLFDGEQSRDKSTKMVRFLDDKWDFYYERGQILNHDERLFNALTSFIDYYMLIILGYDSDSYETEFGGTQLFERAMNIVLLGSGTSALGWKKVSGSSFNRWDLAEELLSVNMGPVRSAFYNYHYNALDIKSSHPNDAYNNMLQAHENINNVRKTCPNSIIIRNFFDLKYIEIAEFFKDYPDKSVYHKFMDYDKAHYQEYNKYIKQ
jgi:hypothetical protein